MENKIRYGQIHLYDTIRCSWDPQIDRVKIRTCVAEISQKPLLVLCFIKSSAGSSLILCRLSLYLSFMLSGLNLREPCYLQVIFAYKLEVYYSSLFIHSFIHSHKSKWIVMCATIAKRHTKITRTWSSTCLLNTQMTLSNTEREN